jgi:hypothetical protein
VHERLLTLLFFGWTEFRWLPPPKYRPGLDGLIAQQPHRHPRFLLLLCPPRAVFPRRRQESRRKPRLLSLPRLLPLWQVRPRLWLLLSSSAFLFNRHLQRSFSFPLSPRLPPRTRRPDRPRRSFSARALHHLPGRARCRRHPRWPPRLPPLLWRINPPRRQPRRSFPRSTPPSCLPTPATLLLLFPEAHSSLRRCCRPPRELFPRQRPRMCWQ